MVSHREVIYSMRNIYNNTLVTLCGIRWSLDLWQPFYNVFKWRTTMSYIKTHTILYINYISITINKKFENQFIFVLKNWEKIPWWSNGLGLCVSTAGVLDLIPGCGTKIPQAAWHCQKKKKKNWEKKTHKIREM